MAPGGRDGECHKDRVRDGCNLYRTTWGLAEQKYSVLERSARRTRNAPSYTTTERRPRDIYGMKMVQGADTIVTRNNVHLHGVCKVRELYNNQGVPLDCRGPHLLFEGFARPC